jgi:hypothetical protein
VIEFTPKASFAKGPSAASWNEIAASKVFVEATSAAILQMQANLGMAKHVDEAASFHYKMEGARIFLSILTNLTSPPEPVRRSETTLPPNLDHKI